MIYYHLTTIKRLQSIIDNGLILYNLSEHEGGIFLFTDILDCFEWADNFWCGRHRVTDNEPFKRKAILKIKLPNVWKLYRDSDRSMKHYGQSLYSKKEIPSDFIVGIYKVVKKIKPKKYGNVNYKLLYIKPNVYADNNNFHE
jgi:hypothetical protein